MKSSRQPIIPLRFEYFLSCLGILFFASLWIGQGTKNESLFDKKIIQVLKIPETCPDEIPNVSPKKKTSNFFLALTSVNTSSSLGVGTLSLQVFFLFLGWTVSSEPFLYSEEIWLSLPQIHKRVEVCLLTTKYIDSNSQFLLLVQ